MTRELKERLGKEFGVNPSGRLDQIFNRVIRQEFAGGNEVLDLLEKYNGIRNTTAKKGGNTHLADMIIDDLESIRNSMKNAIEEEMKNDELRQDS